MTGYTFRASWPITNPDLPMSVLRAEACRDIDAIAARAGARIVGEVTWTVASGHLIAQAPAKPIKAQEAA